MKTIIKKSLASLITSIALVSTNALADTTTFKPIVLFQGDWKSGSYQHLIDNGIQRFEASSGVDVERRTLERNNNAYLKALKEAANQGYSPIIVQDSNSIATFDKFARAYPSIRFISLDVAYNVPNILGLTFNHAEGAYVIGFLAGLKTKNNKVGFVGGINIPVINNFQCGYELGVTSANPNAEVTVEYIDRGIQSWDDIEAAREISQSMLSDKVDIIFPVAGYASLGVLEAVKEHGYSLSFGVDHDYSKQYPNTTLASLEKKVDVAVFAALTQLNQGIWNGNHKHFGIKQGVINISLNQGNPNLTETDKRIAKRLIAELKGKNNAISQKIEKNCSTQS